MGIVSTQDTVKAVQLGVISSVAEDGGHGLQLSGVSGDRSNAALLVVNPVMEMHLARQWSVSLSGAYYSRRTYYKYYDKVHANTFETKIGLNVRL